MMEKEAITDLRLITTIGDFDNNLEISIDNGVLEFRISKKYLFQTLKERKTIVGLVNKKLDELVEEQINTMAKKEEERNNSL